MMTCKTVTAASINECNRTFWEGQAVLLKERMADENIRSIAFETLQSEELKGLPLYLRTSLERALEDAAKAKVRFQDELDETFQERAKKQLSAQNKKAADIRHNRPGGSREKHNKIRAVWASGKYSTRDKCAERECGALGMSFSSARKALRNIPRSPKK